MITTKKQGITQIYATSEDNGAISDSLTLTVKDPTTHPPASHCGDIKGTLKDNLGAPLVGYYVTLCSDPVTAITNANGVYQFANNDFTAHTLIVNDANMVEQKRFTLNFTQGSSPSTTITGDVIDITYTRRTANIEIDIEQNATMEFVAGDISFTEIQIDSEVKVENPSTRYYD